MSEKITILDIDFDNVSLTKAVDMIFESVADRNKKIIQFINANCLNISISDKEYKKILKKSDHIFPDGSGINMACKILKTPVIDNVNGTDMLPLLCKKSLLENRSFFFLGSEPEVIRKMSEKINEKFPGINIKGFHDGYFSQNDNPEIIDQINKAETDILLVGMGTPLQEKWISKNQQKLNVRVIIGVGGLFDFYSGKTPRAPKILRRYGLEWGYRLYKEPFRLFRRYVFGNPLFIMRILWWKFSRQKE